MLEGLLAQPARVRPGPHGATGEDAPVAQQEGLQVLTTAAQVHLCGRYRKLVGRGKRQTVVATAIAREMAAFLWAIGGEVVPHPAA